MASESSSVPVSILTGFLGAGKTTLLKHALENKAHLRVATVVNDLASVNIDAKLVRGAEAADGVVELQNGCACCSVADELLASLGDLASRGDGFDHIVVESSGVSEPRALRDNLRAAEAAGEALFERAAQASTKPPPSTPSSSFFQVLFDILYHFS